MRMFALGLGLVSLMGCASSGPAKFGTTNIMGGENGDLRVFVDHHCPQAASLETLRQKYVKPDSRYVEGLAVEALAHIGSLAFKSFGTFLQKAGEASSTQSFGATGGYFYAPPRSGEPGPTRNISPEMRCIYLVRGGFALQPAQFVSSASEDLRKTWSGLGLNRTPDFFATLHLETTSDVELISVLPEHLRSSPPAEVESAPSLQLSPPAPYFRAKLDRLYVREFQDMRAASNYRDLAIVLNYDLAASGTKTPAENADRSQTASHGSPSILAAGGIRLPGLQMGDYRENLLAGLQTGWMRMPAVKKQDEDNPRAAVDLSVYVVESAPGNPLLQSIGAYLAGEPFAAKVEGALQGELSN